MSEYLTKSIFNMQKQTSCYRKKMLPVLSGARACAPPAHSQRAGPFFLNGTNLIDTRFSWVGWAKLGHWASWVD